MSRQEQSVEAGGIAVQGGGDVTLNLSPTAEQFSRLIVEVGKQMIAFHAEGQQKVDQRLEQFKSEMLNEFAKGTSADPQALKDPDFQAALSDAQKSFVRCDDDDVAASLINLISERSQQAQRNRATLSLNAAIEVVGRLTSEDIASLSAIFHTSRAVVMNPDPALIFIYLAQHLGTKADNLPRGNSSLQYLCSVGCLLFNQFRSSTLLDIIVEQYGVALSEPFDADSLVAAVPDAHPDKIKSLLVPTAPYTVQIFTTTGTVAHARKFRFNATNPTQLKAKAAEVGVSAHLSSINSFADKQKWTREKISEELFKAHPSLKKFDECWTASGMGSYSLTPVGIAVAHSNARRLFADFRVPLSVWIQ